MSFIKVCPTLEPRYMFFGVEGACPFKISEYILEHGDQPNVLTNYLESYAAKVFDQKENTIAQYRHELLKYLFGRFMPSKIPVFLPNATVHTVGDAKLNEMVLGRVCSYQNGTLIPMGILQEKTL